MPCYVCAIHAANPTPEDIYTKLVHSLEMTRSEERLLEVLPHCYIL